MTGDIQAEDLILLIRKLNLDLTSQLESVLRYKGMSGFQVYFMDERFPGLFHGVFLETSPGRDLSYRVVS